MFHLVPYWCIRRTQYIPELGLFYKKWGGLWKEYAPELMGVKLFLDNVQLVQLKKYGNNAFIH